MYSRTILCGRHPFNLSVLVSGCSGTILWLAFLLHNTPSHFNRFRCYTEPDNLSQNNITSQWQMLLISAITESRIVNLLLRSDHRQSCYIWVHMERIFEQQWVYFHGSQENTKYWMKKPQKEHIDINEENKWLSSFHQMEKEIWKERASTAIAKAMHRLTAFNQGTVEYLLVERFNKQHLDSGRQVVIVIPPIIDYVRPQCMGLTSISGISQGSDHSSHKIV